MTAPSLLDELEEVVRLAEKATPGKWAIGPYGGVYKTDSQCKLQNALLVGASKSAFFENRSANEAYATQAVNFIRAHHAEIADMAKRLETTERTLERCKQTLDTTSEGWRLDAERLEAAERDARATKRSAETLCRIYFEIAAEAVGEDKVRAERDRRIHATQEGEG